MNYYISDTHFCHENIIKYCHRPFSSIGEMNTVIIKKWNSKVKKEDTVFHLGDFGLTKSTEAPSAPKDTFKSVISQLNGNIILINGSHDSNNGCKSIIESMVIKTGGFRIYMTHDPKYAKEQYPFNFTGHRHGKDGMFNKKGKSIVVDLSVENTDYYPLNINEIMQLYSGWKKVNKGK